MSSNLKKYIGLDVHKEATSIAVLNGVGKLVDPKNDEQHDSANGGYSNSHLYSPNNSRFPKDLKGFITFKAVLVD
jgi:hypothetical protein